MIPWFPGGHADPWNHVEAAMALALGGRRAEAERAYEWLVGMQRADGSWHQYYLADGVEQDKLDANVCAYVAAGVWHHCLLTRDRGFLETMWPVVERAIDFVLDLQTPARRDHLGPPRRRHAVVVRPAHRLVVASATACAARSRSPSTSATSAPTGSSSAGRPRPRHRARAATRSRRSTAGRWTGTTRCSPASSRGAGRPQLGSPSARRRS